MEDPLHVHPAKPGEPASGSASTRSPQAPESTTASPNHIPGIERVWNGILSVLLLGYGTYGLIDDDIYIPGKRGPGIHFHGLAAGLLFCAMVCASANMISVLVDHWDKRNNETNYRMFARASQGAGFVLFFAAMLVQCSSV